MVPSAEVAVASALLLVLACLVWPGVGAPRAAAGAGAGRRRCPLRACTKARPGTRNRSGGAAGTRHPRVARAAGRLTGRRGRGRTDWVADFAEVVAVGLDAGLDLPSAAVASARSPGVQARVPWLAERLVDSIGHGRGLTVVLDGETALAPEDRGDLGFLLAAWRLAEEVGAGASAVTAAAASTVRERRVASERTAAVVAGPRASMLLLSLLPLVGPLAAALVGLPPGRLYESAVSRLLAAVGLVLTASGWWWARRLLARASRPGRTGDPVP